MLFPDCSSCPKISPLGCFSVSLSSVSRQSRMAWACSAQLSSGPDVSGGHLMLSVVFGVCNFSLC